MKSNTASAPSSGAESLDLVEVDDTPSEAVSVAEQPALPVPDYLNVHYWWAYVHPNAVRVFERPWLVNLILWGNYTRLRDAGLAHMGDALPGKTLQVACAYGSFTPELAERAAAGGGTLDVVDILDVQLDNLKSKLRPGAPVRLMKMDSSALRFADESYDRAVLFFLLHEQPEHVRLRTIAEALRVVKPGGKLVIVDYAQPFKWNPMRYFFRPILAVLEPFALDLWNSDLTRWLPQRWRASATEPVRYFGGLYQLIVVTR
jgi:ubiquinone/menaquinone biosynthesis C-methylase UbiE